MAYHPPPKPSFGGSKCSCGQPAETSLRHCEALPLGTKSKQKNWYYYTPICRPCLAKHAPQRPTLAQLLGKELEAEEDAA